MSEQQHEKICEECAEGYFASIATQKYCSPACRKQAFKRRAEWDLHYGEFCFEALQVTSAWHTDEQRANWAEQLALLRKLAPPRP